MLKQGFLAAAKRLASEVRGELGLSDSDKFDPWAWADLYGVQVYPLSALSCRPDSLAHFQQDGSGDFSAALIPIGGARIIVENDAHTLARRRANVSHEAAHYLLEHPFEESILSEEGQRRWHAAMEDEANCLAGELLVPFAAAKRAAFANSSDEQVAAKFGVSVEYARMRMNRSGARTIARRAVGA